jgi:hypothetical protein
MLLSNAKLIKTYSVYGWTSGFVNWAAKIHDVRLGAHETTAEINEIHHVSSAQHS